MSWQLIATIAYCTYSENFGCNKHWRIEVYIQFDMFSKYNQLIVTHTEWQLYAQ